MLTIGLKSPHKEKGHELGIPFFVGASYPLQVAPYAIQNDADEGRFYTEEGHPYRSSFQRDRDRIIHSKAFRRLAYKTQVFVYSEGDIYRNRLTHSLEVSQISRSVSFALGLNQDFSEALALAHDLGHPPFAHSGQDILDDLMQAQGGFEHNCQGLRQLTKLEMRYLDFPGLNLTRAVLKGVMKRPRVYECDHELRGLAEERRSSPPVLEARLVDICDRIAYLHHDLEDGLDAAILKRHELVELEHWKEAWTELKEKKGKRFKAAREAICIRAVIRHMLDMSIRNLIQNSLKNIEAANKGEGENEGEGESVICLGPKYQSYLKQLHKYLHRHFYNSERVCEMSTKGTKIIESLFKRFLQFPEEMPEHYQSWISKEGLHRTVADYIAGMTDRFAENIYAGEA